MKTPDNAHMDTLAIHAGQQPDPTTGAIMTPVYFTSTYVQDGPGGHKGYEYSRTQNPTRDALQGNLAALEGGTWGLCYASGCAAATSLVASLNAGDHVVCGDDVYGGTFRLFDKVFRRLGIQFTYVDQTDLAATAAAFKPNTRMVWVETPTNPMLKIIDIAAVAELAKKHKATLVVDNTFATPFLQRPLDLGADVVLHSTTKYMGGHSDVVGGALIGRDPQLHKDIQFLQNALGGTPGPMDSFLTLRGTKTLHLRMERHVKNAQLIADWLVGHSKVEKVIYPGLKSHPQHALAGRQMKAPGGMISFVIKGGLEEATRMLKACRIFACAESLGGVESLIEHPAIMTHASIPAENRRKLGIADGFIRLSVGVENVEDLKADLDAALKA
jgi:cystathionine gamma-lyase